MYTSIFALRDHVTFRLLKQYYTADLAECCRVIKLSDWCNSVSKVWIRISSMENKTYQLIYLILTLLCLIFRHVYIFIYALNEYCFHQLFHMKFRVPDKCKLDGIYIPYFLAKNWKRKSTTLFGVFTFFQRVRFTCVSYQDVLGRRFLSTEIFWTKFLNTVSSGKTEHIIL